MIVVVLFKTQVANQWIACRECVVANERLGKETEMRCLSECE